MTTRFLTFFDNAGAPSTFQQYGPFDLGIVGKLLSVRVRGALTFPPTVLGPSSPPLEDSVMYGVQVIPHGGTPLNLPTDAANFEFVVCEAHTPTEIVAAWTPATATGLALVGGPMTLDWAGQQNVLQHADLWLTVAQTYTTAFSFVTTGTVQAVYT